MTDTKPQKKAENTVNNLSALSETIGMGSTSNPQSGTLPQAAALKARFKAGSIPLQTDFADVIDLANVGCQAVGRAEGQTGPADGFTLSSSGLLELKPNKEKGITLDQEGVAVKVNTQKGLVVTSEGLEINDGLGLECINGKLNLKVKANSGFSGGPGGAKVIPGDGIKTDSNGVGVKAGNGVTVNTDGVNVKLAKGVWNNSGGGQGKDGTTSGSSGGLNLTSDGLSVVAGAGMQINVHGVSIRLATNSGLSADKENGLKIVPEQMFQKGMIMMFAGSEAEMPIGWALCDGKNGRPNLQDRFILGSTGFTNINKTNNKVVQGDNEDKHFMVSSDLRTPAINVIVKEHTLTVAQIPPHSHKINTVAGSQHVYANGGYYGIGTHETSKTGGGKGHSHQATANQTSHGHNTNVVPPYYILAFIIKV